MTAGSGPPVLVVDIDGTLVDSNYQHVRSWSRAFTQFDVTVPAWMLHRAIGMGGDQLVAAVAGDGVEQRLGDDIRAAEAVLFSELLPEVVLLPGARDLIRGLAGRGGRVVLASSAKAHEVDHYLSLLDCPDDVYASTSSADVEATKPHPELIEVAIGCADSAGSSLMIGDSIWDCRAASRAGISALGLLTGGFAASELEAAGAAGVYASALELLDAPAIAAHLDA